jgi:hypothetical protein
VVVVSVSASLKYAAMSANRQTNRFKRGMLQGPRPHRMKVGAMTDQTTNPDPEDAEGHSRRFASEDPGTPDAFDTEGHGFRGADNERDEDDDTQGHVKTRSPGFGKDDIDVSEGSRRRI